MSKYVMQLRRGWKWDSDPTTGQPRNDWATYEAKEDHMKPLEGELVLEYDNETERWTLNITPLAEVPES